MKKRKFIKLKGNFWGNALAKVIIMLTDVTGGNLIATTVELMRLT